MDIIRPINALGMSSGTALDGVSYAAFQRRIVNILQRESTVRTR